MATSIRNLFYYADEVNHLFRSFGGSNQYSGFMNWHIPAFVLLLSKNNGGLKVFPEEIWRNTEMLRNEIQDRFLENPPTDSDISEFIYRTTAMIDKLKDSNEKGEWLKFCELFEIKNQSI